MAIANASPTSTVSVRLGDGAGGFSAAMGTFSPEVRAVVTKTDPTKGSQVAFVVTDGSGRQASCF